MVCSETFCIPVITSYPLCTLVSASGTHACLKLKTQPYVKNYVLDTNVLLHDPESILNFEDNNVIIPIEVIEEIDRFKGESSDLGQNARAVSRTLDSLRGKGQLNKGVKLPNGV